MCRCSVALRNPRTLRHTDGGQRPVVVGVLFGLLLLLDDTGLQIALFLWMALAAYAARQLVHAERVVYVVRVGADRLMVPRGHHHGQRHAHGHGALVLGHVRGERRGRRQAGLRQHAGAGQAGQRAQAAGAGHGVGLFVVRVPQAAVGLVVVRLVARVAAALDVPYATFFTPGNQRRSMLVLYNLFWSHASYFIIFYRLAKKICKKLIDKMKTSKNILAVKNITHGTTLRKCGFYSITITNIKIKNFSVGCTFKFLSLLLRILTGSPDCGPT